MNRIAIFCMTAAFILTGCASQIMQNYVGKPVSEAVMDYGPPVAAIETGPEEKAFIWSMEQSTVIPGHSNTSGSVYGVGNSAFFNTQTYTTPSYVASSQCAYTLFAKRTRKDIDGPAAWTVTGFKAPRLMCE